MLSMTEKRSNDPNQVAARVVAQSIANGSDPLPAGLEAAWEQWSRAIAGVDQRGMVLLKAAFEAGWEAGQNRTNT
jgi:hypothetical protein